MSSDPGVEVADFRGARFRATVTITVPVPAYEAMQLFTAHGEREWVDGWEPHFPTGGWQHAVETALVRRATER